MKLPYYLILFIVTSHLFSSCQELEEELDTTTEETSTTPESVTPIVPEPEVVSAPCGFDFEQIDPNTVLELNCTYDLGGKTIKLPENVTLNYQKGAKLFNGTLISNNHSIDGRLLNCTLKIEGTINLKDRKFVFDPSKWCITQGRVNPDIALENRKNFNQIIAFIHDMGAEIFEIDEFDAYFSVSGDVLSQISSAKYSIRIPSDFHLKMSDRTYLRIQPSNGFIDYLLHPILGKNITISGGNLIGDRYDHDYSPITDRLGIERNTHEYGALIMLAGVQNITIDNVNITNSTGDGIIAQGSNIRYPNGTPREGEVVNTNVVIKNCTINESRRNNISLTDGNGYVIENCTITNSGLDVPGNPLASGTDPKASIDMEAYREIEVVNGERVLIEYERLENVIIRNNKFTGNRIGLLFFTVSGVLVENNFFDDGMGSVSANNCIVRNNTFIKGENMELSRAVSFSSILRNGIEQSLNNEISGNIIKGYQIGMNISGEKAKIFNNKVSDFQTGLHIGKRLKDVEIFNNEFSSDRKVCYGYFSLFGTTENVTITNDKVDVNNRAVYLNKINEGITSSNFSLIFDRCSFNADRELFFKDCRNITIQNSILNVEIAKENTLNINEINNTRY